MKESENALKTRKFLEEYSDTLDIKGSALAAGYKKQTASANGHNILKSERARRELTAIINEKACKLQVCKGYIINSYLKILDWALSLDDAGRPNDPALGLRALDSIVRQAESRPILHFLPQKDADLKENGGGIFSSIVGLNPEKI